MYKSLREYIPYLIEISEDNRYFMINRDYEYIGLNTKSNPLFVPTLKDLEIINAFPFMDESDRKKEYEKIILKIKECEEKGIKEVEWNRIYLFDDGCPPWNATGKLNKNIKMIREKMKVLTEGKECLNMNEKTREILNKY